MGEIDYAEINSDMFTLLRIVSDDIADNKNQFKTGPQRNLIIQLGKAADKTKSMTDKAIIDKAYIRELCVQEISKAKYYFEEIKKSEEKEEFIVAVGLNLNENTIQWLLELLAIDINAHL